MKRLKLGDKVTLNGHEGTVTESLKSGFYIRENGPERVHGMNHKFLAGDREEALDFCSVELGYNNGGGFPECNTLEDLTKLVEALQEREKSAEEFATERVKTANAITAPLYTWKNDTLKLMWASFMDEFSEDIEDLFVEGSPIYNRLRDSELENALIEEVVDITIGGMEYYIRKSEVNGLNLITNE